MSNAGIGLVAAMNAGQKTRREGEYDFVTEIEGLTVRVTFDSEWSPAEPDVGIMSAGYCDGEIVSVFLMRDDGTEIDITPWADILPLDEPLADEVQRMGERE